MQEAFIDELGFWKDYCAQASNRPWLEQLANCSLPIEPKTQRLLDQLNLPRGTTVRALDIGCGPLSVLSRYSPVYPIDLTGIDPLANEYAGLLAAQNLRQHYPVIARGAEEIGQLFPAGHFDFVFSRNALDHCQDPAKVIRNAIVVCRDGGIVHFSVFPCEGEHANYGGLHQWNFELIDGAVVIWNAANRIKLDSLVAPYLYEAIMVPIEAGGYSAQIEVTIKKNV